MSDASERWCKKCRQTEMCCDCEDPDTVESVVTLRMQGKPSIGHPFWDERKKYNE